MNDYRIVIRDRQGHRTQLTCRPSHQAAEKWLTWLTGTAEVWIGFYDGADGRELAGEKNMGQTSITWRH